MIFQALNDYYERKRNIDAKSVPPVAFEENAISFVVVLERDGSVVNVEDIRLSEGRKKRGSPVFVPQSQDRTGKNAWRTAFLLWDHPRFVFGVTGQDDVPDMGEKRIGSFRLRIAEVFPDPTVDPGVLAVTRFYGDPRNLERIKRDELWKEIAGGNGNVSFRLREAEDLVCQSEAVLRASQRVFEADPGAGIGLCLITGETASIERLHSATPILGSQSTAKIHSFNLDAFHSFCKEQGANAPVGKRAAFGYTTALNHLLRRDSPQKFQVGDATTVFWGERKASLETEFSTFFDEPPTDDPGCGARAVTALLDAARQGVGPFLDDKTRFFVLGLAPNAARIAIRFWHVGTVADMAGCIVRHFHDLEIEHGPHDRSHLSIFRLLVASAAQGKADNISPNLGGELMRAILAGLPYPDTLFQGALRRIRAEHEITYPRAAILKACLNRKSKRTEEEMTVSLDKENMNVGYRLGRLFAVLERVQEEANPGINATIRDRFYGAASSTPATVFPNLMRLKNHHVAKLENPGRRVNLEKLIGQIVNGLSPAFPPLLPMDDQGRFAIGYYHQRMDKSTYSNQGE